MVKEVGTAIGYEMIYFLGDLHGDFAKLHYLEQHMEPDDIIIQVGDFGFYPNRIPDLNPKGYPCKVYVIDGNHEHYPYLAELVDRNEISEFLPNMFYVPRGEVMEIEGNLIGFLGGGCSIDVTFTKPYGHWHWQETITEDDVQTLIENVGDRQLDILVAHAAPRKLITNNFTPLNHTYWRLPIGWEDASSIRIEKAINILKPTQFVCGHMHRSVIDGNQRILDIDEVVDLEQLLSNG